MEGRFSGSGNCHLYERAILKIGDDFSINDNYKITLNADTSVAIGDDCMFSNDVVVRSNDGHTIFDVNSGQNINFTYEICKKRKVNIGNHVWIGQKAFVLYNTEIGDGSIIGANSLVKGIVPNNCIAAGSPAKVIRKNIAWSRKEGA